MNYTPDQLRSLARRIVFFVVLLASCLPWLNAQITPEAQETTEARANYAQAFAIGSAALQGGEYAKAEQAFREALKLQPDSLPILNNLAITLARQHREEEAIALYERALQVKPGDANTERNLGVAYFRAARYGAALGLLKAFAKESHSYQALNLVGLDLFALNQYDEAAKYLEQAHRLQPYNLETLSMLGHTYLRMKDYEGMTRVFGQIMAVQPNSVEAHMMMAMAYDKLFREDDAIREFKAADAIKSNYPGIHTGLGVIYFRNENFAPAEKEFREELRNYPKDPVANCTLGRILRRLNRPAEALPYLEAALKENPEYLDDLLELGEGRLDLQQPEAAIEALRRTVALKPEDAQAHFILGGALMKAGHTEEGSKERELSGKLLAAQRADSSSPR